MNSIHIIEVVLTSLTSIVVALIGAGVFKNWIEKRNEKKHKGNLIRQIKKDEIVHFALRELRRLYGVDRIYIAQYHNGGNFYTNSPMQKFSITYERCSDGLERITDKFQGVFVSHFNWYIRKMIRGEMFYLNVEEIEDISTRAVLSSYGVQSHISCPIYDKEKHIIGHLGMDWVFSEVPSEISDNKEFTKDFINDIQRESNSLYEHI